MGDRKDKHREFKALYESALECDGWGDVEAAEEAYGQLHVLVRKEAEGGPCALSRYEITQAAKLGAMLGLRVKELRRGVDLGVGPDSCKELRTFFNDFLLDPEAEFPFDVSPEAVGEAPVVMQMEALTFGGGGGGGTGSGGSSVVGFSEQEGGSLMPPLRLQGRGDRAMTVKIVKVGLKDAADYIDPFVTVSVVSRDGKLLEATQDTPPTNKRQPNYVQFGSSVHIQTPINQVENTAAIVIEFKHYKPKKKLVSTKAWCFLTMSELDLAKETQEMALEIYAKPTDLRCKKLSLLSVKKLYLHLECMIRTE
mmetsp:Transcript_35610/g.88993  ORF Transcript_35610/g.88993 Transcript_35610/m.88993 type:complete len:310 (-) Transcript_35610:1549-2478(-)